MASRLRWHGQKHSDVNMPLLFRSIINRRCGLWSLVLEPDVKYQNAAVSFGHDSTPPHNYIRLVPTLWKDLPASIFYSLLTGTNFTELPYQPSNVSTLARLLPPILLVLPAACTLDQLDVLSLLEYQNENSSHVQISPWLEPFTSDTTGSTRCNILSLKTIMNNHNWWLTESLNHDKRANIIPYRLLLSSPQHAWRRWIWLTD